MTHEVNHNSGPEKSGAFPECCKDAAEKTAGCGPMMEKMMARFGAKPGEGPCGDEETHE